MEKEPQELSLLHSYVFAASLNDRLTVAGISVVCSKLIGRGLLEGKDIEQMFTMLVGSVPRVPGEASVLADETIELLNSRRDMLLSMFDEPVPVTSTNP